MKRFASVVILAALMSACATTGGLNAYHNAAIVDQERPTSQA